MGMVQIDFSHRLNLFFKFCMGNVLSHPGGGHFGINSAHSGQEWRHKRNCSILLFTEISERVIANNSIVIAEVSIGYDLNLLIVILGCQNIYHVIRIGCA